MVERLTDGLWRPWLLGAFLLVGLWCSVRSGFFQIFGVKTWWNGSVGALKKERGGGKGLSQMQTLATALASTIGTGAVAGVATALFFGGPGAVFWMWVSALLGMMTSFAEKALAVKYRVRTAEGWEGGPMEYMRGRLGWRLGAAWFALWCAMAALTGGALVQANSIAHTLQAAFGWGRLTVGLGIALCVGAVLLGGVRGIGRVSEAVVPVMAALFLGAGMAILWLRREALLPALREIVTCALTPRAAWGGAAGAALRYGVARGVFPNEAGGGSSAMAHAAAGETTARRAGFWGIFETCFSTLVVCTVTALVILTTGVLEGPEGLTGAALARAAFGVGLGRWGEVILTVCLLLFAFTSLLGWSYYGQRGAGWLGVGRVPFQILYLAAVILGSVGQVETVWVLCDLCIGCMAIPNLLAILALSGEVLPMARKP